MTLEVGMIIKGKVSGIKEFGAFVDLDNNVTGMVHISEVAPTYVKEIKDYLKEGQEVQVKVLSIADNGKISLSIKQATEQQRPSRGNNRGNHSGNGYTDKSARPQRRPQRTPPAPVTSPGDFEWTSQRRDTSESFEDMMSKFKQSSEDKMSDLKSGNEGRGYNRKFNGRNKGRQ